VVAFLDKGPYAYQPKTGTRGRGHTYERRVGQLLTLLTEPLGWHLHDHKWINSSEGWVQPDFVLVSPSGRGLIIECKLTWRPTNQLSRYERILASLGLPCIAVLACRNLTPETPRPVCSNFESLTPHCTWHLFL
jgi:hypothetical protein